MQTLLKTFSILLVTLLVGCTSQPQQQSMQPTGPQRPAWIDNPNSVGGVVGLGEAGIHFKGRAAQRELATRRALDAIATQMGVTVNNVMLMNQQHTNTSSNVNISSRSEHSIEGALVNAVIHGEWQEGGVIYVLMVAR